MTLKLRLLIVVGLLAAVAVGFVLIMGKMLGDFQVEGSIFATMSSYEAVAGHLSNPVQPHPPPQSDPEVDVPNRRHDGCAAASCRSRRRAAPVACLQPPRAVRRVCRAVKILEAGAAVKVRPMRVRLTLRRYTSLYRLVTVSLTEPANEFYQAIIREYIPNQVLANTSFFSRFAVRASPPSA
jgi:hypothetical protein